MNDEQDPRIIGTLDNLFAIAVSKNESAANGRSSLEVRIRATLALAVFLPHPEAKKRLIALMASEESPKEVRGVASQALM